MDLTELTIFDCATFPEADEIRSPESHLNAGGLRGNEG